MEKDYIVRAMAGNGQIRAFVATTRNLTEYARCSHNTSPVVTAALGRMLTAGALMGGMMKGDADLLTLKIQGNGPMSGITVTADSKGNVKGYPNVPDVMLPPNSQGKLDVGGAIGLGVLSVIKDLGLKDPYVGQVELKTGEIAEDLTYYFATSEQIPSAVALGVLMNKENTVRCAGGFVIQLMPFASDELVDELEKKLAILPSITTLLDRGMTPEDILEFVLEGFEPKIVDRLDTQFLCNCDKKRVEKALISIGKKDIDEMISEGNEIELKCHFCNSAYHFSIDELKELRSKI